MCETRISARDVSRHRRHPFGRSRRSTWAPSDTASAQVKLCLAQCGKRNAAVAQRSRACTVSTGRRVGGQHAFGEKDSRGFAAGCDVRRRWRPGPRRVHAEVASTDWLGEINYYRSVQGWRRSPRMRRGRKELRIIWLTWPRRRRSTRSGNTRMRTRKIPRVRTTRRRELRKPRGVTSVSSIPDRRNTRSTFGSLHRFTPLHC